MTTGLLLCVLAVAFENMAVTAAMPAAATELGDLPLYAWAFTAVMIPQIVAITVAGRWADRHGPVRPLAWGLAIFAAGIVAAALADSMLALLVGRAVQGLGAGGISLALLVVTGRAYDRIRRARVMTWFSACWVLPSFVGPVIAAWLSESLSWRWVFWAVLPLVATGAALVLPGLVRLGIGGSDQHDTQIRLRAALAVAVGAALLQASGQDLTWWSLTGVVVAAVLLGAWLPGVMPRGFSLTAGGLSSTVLTRLLIGGSFFAMMSFLPLLLVQRGVPLVLAGASLALSSIGWLLGSWVQARPWLTLSRDRIVGWGAVAICAGLIVVAAGAWLPALGVGVPVVGSGIAGFGMGLAMASTSLVTMQLSLEADLGRNTSSLQVSEVLGNAIIAGGAGTLFAALPTTEGSPETFGWIGMLLVGTSALGILTARRIGPVANYSAVASPSPGN
ncbi:MAG: MFS transporter [Propioniciclava sp.]